MGAFDSTFGALLVGVVFAAVLYGFTCIQTWYYFVHYPSDRWYIKLLASVVAVLLADTTHQAIITHAVYTYLVTYWGVPSFLETVVWSLVVEVFFNSLITLWVQCFLVMRIYKLSNKSWSLAGIAGVFVAAQFLLAIISGAKTLHLTKVSQLGSVRELAKSVSATVVVGDSIITLILCILLQRSRTGFQKSGMLISKLIVFSVNTGLLTSVFALASLITITAWPNAFIYITFYFCTGRLYCNTLLVTLNARKILRGEGLDDMPLTSTSGQKTTSNKTMTRSGLQHIPTNISIMVDTTQECTHDERYSSTCDVKTPVV